MKLGVKFNRLTYKEYFHCIENYKRYTDFNTLGLYRSILENKKLDLQQQIELRDFANTFFGKTYHFLELKDPDTYIALATLGLELTQADHRQRIKDVIANQERILSEKKIKHRNFGTYSKHDCGIETCSYNGLMIKQDSYFAECSMRFDSDKKKYSRKQKANRIKKERQINYTQNYLEEMEDIFDMLHPEENE